MKKQLLVAAVAVTISATSMATISLTGDAEFTYKNSTTEVGTNKSTSKNKTSTEVTSTEVNLHAKGTHGATTIITDFKMNGGNNDSGPKIEDMYVVTNFGPVKAKLGNYAASTKAIVGEIENGGRSNGQIILSYTTNGIKIYAGNAGNAGNNDSIDDNMFVGVVATVAGWKLQAKKNNEVYNSLGVAGKAGPVGIRVELLSSNDDDSDAMFAHITANLDNIKLGLAMLDADNNNTIKEDDSSIFAVSNGSDDYKGKSNSNTQLSASMGVDGTTYTAKVGKIGSADSSVTDNDYFQVSAQRALASGITATVVYTDREVNSNKTNTVFEVKLAVKF